MSTRPHTALPWPAGRTGLPLLALGCVHCDSGIGDRTFRVIADSELVHTRLLVSYTASLPGQHAHPTLATSRSGRSPGRRPPLGREHRWPRPWLHQAAARARSLLTRERMSGPARYRRRR